MQQVTKEFLKYNLHILGISEVRWLGKGEHPTQGGERLLFSGNESGKHESGVGFLLSKHAKKSLISWTPINERVITARFYTRFRKVTFIQCYAPTNNASKEDKDEFYDILEKTIKDVNSGDIKILMGDLNAKVGAQNENLEEIMGKNGVGQINENGTYFTQFCSNANLVIGGTLFPHKQIHKTTWVSPDKKTHNQIDHITISRKWRSSLLDVRNKRGADVASDHHLIVGTLRIKLAVPKQPADMKRIKLNIEKLRIPQIAKSFKEKMQETINQKSAQKWENMADNIIEVAKTTIGVKSRQRKEWISENTWLLIEDRKRKKHLLLQNLSQEYRAAAQVEYTGLCQKVKREARRDKRRWIDDICRQAEEAMLNNNSRELYNLTKKLANKYSTRTHFIKSKNGRLLVESDKQLERWREHFSDMLSANETINWEPENNPGRQLNIDSNPPSVAEITAAIKTLKNNKAAGADNVPAELLKVNATWMANELYHCIKEAWNNNKIPTKWKEGLIIKLPKKGNLTECNNWRGITLLNTINKIIAKIVQTRLAETIENTLRPNQAGFRPNRSCIDHINTLRIIIEQSVEWRSPLFIAFIDFEKAFDSLNHDALWRILKSRGVPTKIISILQELYTDANCSVLHNGEKSESFTIHRGVKQGCVISPLLFNIALDYILAKVDQNRDGLRWTLTSHLSDLDYADDICLMSHTFEGVSRQLTTLAREASKIGLRINIAKTKEMRINTNNTLKLQIDNTEIEEVKEFLYLGSIIDIKGGTDADINNRIKKAQQSFRMLSTVWKSSVYTLRTKLRIFRTNVKSTLLYGCETWRSTSSSTHKLQTFINKCLRMILRIFWPMTISNDELHRRCDETPIINQIRKRKWGWIGHILRRDAGDIARNALEWNPQGKRRVGRPANTWRRSTIEELRNQNMGWNEAKAVARNRVRWRALSEALCST